ncbi:thiamine pyrophosphate-binding protein [Streptomyces sp. SM13]|uniref:thiamine pyrophosphate-binding protein n=1 Tax=Streptomyces sp. SM13 TaxID=1983803 RepID=UPI000CD4D24D
MATTTHDQPPLEMSGAAAALWALERAGIRVVFGIPGGANLPFYDTLRDFPAVRHILTRHEQGAGHAASGYAQATGGLGVCVATSGPGATNLVTPLMDAYMDSIPILALTGQVASSQLGTDAFQETDICSIVAPVTKYAVEVTEADAIGPAISSEPFRVQWRLDSVKGLSHGTSLFLSL